MVKPPRIRHSKAHKDAATIDLEPGEAKWAGQESPEAGAETLAGEAVASTVPDQSVTAETAGSEPGSHGAETPEGTEREPSDAAPEPHGGSPSTASGGGGETGFGRSATSRTSETARRSGMSAVAGGVIGAVIALGGAGVLQWTGVLPNLSGPEVTSAELDRLREQLAALGQEIAAGPPPSSDQAVVGALGEANSRLDGLDAALGELRENFDTLRSSIQQDGGNNGAAGPALEDRLAEIESAVAALPAGAEPSEEADRRIASLEEAQQSASELAAANASRLEGLEQSVAEISERLEAQAAEPGMMVAVAAAALKSAIDRGTPFMTELETYAAVAPGAPEIAELRDLAASGVPTRAAIEAEADDAANRMIAAARPTDPEAGLIEELWTSARSLIQVRPVGHVEGEDIPAIVARLEAAVREGNYQQAIQEYEALPEPAKAAGDEFIEKVRARLTADQLVAQALSGVIRSPGSEG
jgi:hypothetical protein